MLEMYMSYYRVCFSKRENYTTVDALTKADSSKLFLSSSNTLSASQMHCDSELNN